MRFNTLFSNHEANDFLIKLAGITSLAIASASGGTFFFTRHHPLSGAAYMSTVAITCFVAYKALEKLKEYIHSPRIKNLVTAVQLFQIPLVFYMAGGKALPQALKLELTIATAHFLAIPVFFYLAIRAWNDPTTSNLSTATGVMLSLANGLKSYL